MVMTKDSVDAVELARNIKTVGYAEWLDVTDGLLFYTCSDCGSSDCVMVKVTGPDMVRVRITHENELTQASRESDNLLLPLYRELVVLREQNMNLRKFAGHMLRVHEHRDADLADKLVKQIMEHGHDEASPADIEPVAHHPV
jgi:hypothetical protein